MSQIHYHELKSRVYIDYPGSSAGKESAYNSRDPGSNSWVGKIPWRSERLPTPVFLGFPGSSAGKESTCNVGNLGSIPGLGRSQEKGTATHSSILAWRTPWTIPWGHKGSDTTEWLSLYIVYIRAQSLCCTILWVLPTLIMYPPRQYHTE